MENRLGCFSGCSELFLIALRDIRRGEPAETLINAMNAMHAGKARCARMRSINDQPRAPSMAEKTQPRQYLDRSSHLRAT